MANNNKNNNSNDENDGDAGRIIIGLSMPHLQDTADVAKLLRNARADGFDFVTTPLPKTLEARLDVTELSSQWWSGCVVGELDSLAFDGLDCAWAHHMNLPAVILPPIPPDQVHEYAAQLSSQALKVSSHSFQFWIPVYLNADSLRDFTIVYRMCDSNHHVAVMIVFEPVPVSLGSLTADEFLAEKKRCLHLALGQGFVRAAAVAADTFALNKRGYPILTRLTCQLTELLLQRIGRTVRLLLRGPAQNTVSLSADQMGLTGCSPYVHYLQHLRRKDIVSQKLDTIEAKLEADYLDGLQIPLQPLKDQLEFGTYETFEKDPVKYKVYQQAIARALTDRQAAAGGAPVTTTIFVAGAGRGPLVTCALEAYELVFQNHPTNGISIVAVEKNPSAIIYLLSKQKHDALWKKYHVQIVAHDLRLLSLDHCGGKTADIVVSELLGSFGDNELSPECLDAFFRTEVARSDTISIPMRYTAFLAPVSSAKLHCQAKSQALYPNQDESDVHGLRKAMETPYVVRAHAASQLHPEQECWSFVHPSDSPDNRRSKTLDFEPQQGADDGLGSGYGPRMNDKDSMSTHVFPDSAWTLVGFLGTFSADLYYSKQTEETCKISNAPCSFSVGMFSWFPLFFPLREPVHVPANATVRAYMWRHVDLPQQKVWYEWSVVVHRDGELFSVTPIHNAAGRSYHVSLN